MQEPLMYSAAERIKLSELIVENPYLMLMLEHFGIDVPLQEKTIQDICNEKNIDPLLFITFVNLYNGTEQSDEDAFTKDDISILVNYLGNSHRYYVDEVYPNILGIIKKMKEENDHPEMGLVERFFEKYFNEVIEHFDYENNIVFPYIIDLQRSIERELETGTFGKYSVSEYKDHHDDIEEKLNDLKNLLIKYLPQKNDQVLRRKLLICLSQLEFDLNIHSRIEDMILIPLVAKMEKQLQSEK